MKLKCLEATDSNGTELYLFQLEDNLFISVPKRALEFKPLSPKELKKMKGADDKQYRLDSHMDCYTRSRILDWLSDRKEQTMRCEHCEYRYSWDCEDYWISDSKICNDFKVDFDSLTDKQKKEIQKRLMRD